MHRRAFIATAAAGGLVALGFDAFGSSPSASPLAIHKALKIGMITGGATLSEKFAIAREAGFAGVELDAPAEVDAEELADAKQSSGVVVPGVVNSAHWSKPLNHQDESVREEGLAAFEQAIRDANAWCDRGVGQFSFAPTVLLVPAVVDGTKSYDEAYDLSIRGIARVLPLAKELGVQIAIENVWNNFLLSPVEAARYVDELNEIAGDTVVGWYLDVGNLWRYGWPTHWVRALGSRIMRLDIKAYSRAKADSEGKWAGFGAEIGDGDIDWAATRRALSSVGFTGWAVAEVGGGDLERLQSISARLDRVLGLG
ncbi:MAG: sugar phosphate isomerase/epimerase family protein [Planctomycetota bacterium]